ncbi:MAG: hypothetical protein JOS17DRAFT_826905 [Linnemannia elongata]|nr:MAG: hypothetical protein JOS17DRAFT_826905 [Linnemannia elongata]
MPGDTYKIQYFFEHNHKLGSSENIGYMRKSEAIKLSIKALIMRGMSITAIMNQLTMDHAKFARFLEGKETMALSRDNFITYDDVYNILHAITAKEAKVDLLCTMPYHPAVVITDQGQNKINAIQYTFDFKPRMIYYAWHVLQAWERNFTIANLGMTDLKTAERKARKDRIRKQLKDILYALTEEESNTLLDSFRAEWQDTAPKLLKYLDDNYLAHNADRRR